MCKVISWRVTFPYSFNVKSCKFWYLLTQMSFQIHMNYHARFSTSLNFIPVKQEYFYPYDSVFKSVYPLFILLMTSLHIYTALKVFNHFLYWKTLDSIRNSCVLENYGENNC